MNIFQQISDLRSLSSPVVLAIGVFDGVHAGHQAVIAAAQRRAMERGAEMVLVTFEPHPLKVLRPDLAPKRLCSPNHQTRLLAHYGVNHVLICDFTPDFARMSADDFVLGFVGACQHLDAIFVGETWRFGAGRKGDVALLRKHGEAHGFEVMGTPVLLRDGEPISSTRVRQAVTNGDLAEANALLARDYSVQGRVIEGRKLARSLGFPTANIQVENEQLPPPGVYAVRACVDNGGAEVWLPGVANLGLRPTVEVGAESLAFEVHIFDFDRDLYGQVVEVRYVKHLRDEQKFAGLDALKAQIGLDCEAARAALA